GKVANDPMTPEPHLSRGGQQSLPLPPRRPRLKKLTAVGSQRIDPDVRLPIDLDAPGTEMVMSEHVQAFLARACRQFSHDLLDDKVVKGAVEPRVRKRIHARRLLNDRAQSPERVRYRLGAPRETHERQSNHTLRKTA